MWSCQSDTRNRTPDASVTAHTTPIPLTHTLLTSTSPTHPSQHFVGYQVLQTEPAHQVTSIQGRIELQRVTADDTTFVRWTTDFSNDADAAVIQDQKYKKLEVGGCVGGYVTRHTTFPATRTPL